MDCGIEILNIRMLHIEEKINCYAVAKIIIDVDDKEGENAVKQLGRDTSVVITTTSESESLTLFHGYPQNIIIRFHGAYQIEMDLAGSIHKLDVKRKKRSFQNIDSSFYDIFHQIVVEENKESLHQWSRVQEKTKALYVQYEETDWEFIKRLASQLRLVVFANMGKGASAVHIGIPKRTEKAVQEINFIKGMITNQYSGKIVSLRRLEFVSKEYYEFGDSIRFQGKTYVITKKETDYENAIIQYQYYGALPEEIIENSNYNERIIGAGICATVLERKKGYAKVQLDIDEEQSKSSAYWFPIEVPYAAGGGIGWCFEAKEGERVIVNFPDIVEKRARIRSILHRDSDSNDKLQDNSVRYLGSAEEAEIKLDASSVIVTGTEGVMIELSEEKGIEIKSSKKIRIESYKDIELLGKKITIKADDRIELATVQGSIIVDETMHLKAIQGVWSNGEPV